MGKVAICAIFKNEEKYIQEWIAFHRVVGFDKFFLYDNDSTDASLARIIDLDLADIVTVESWPQRPGQIAAYQHFLANYSSSCEWVAFIDVDEFIHPLNDEDIVPCLEAAASHPAILVNWLNFGPSNHIRSPEGLVIENFTRRLAEENPVNFHVKTIARCKMILHVGGAHVCALRGDPCDATGATIENAAIVPVRCSGPLIINHYYTKSLEDWQKKVSTGRATVPDVASMQRRPEWVDHYLAHANVLDERICRFATRVKASLPVHAHR